MTASHAAQSTAGSLLAGAEQTAGTYAERIRATWETYGVYLTTLAKLNALTDRQLEDIGLDRADLKETARRAAYGF